eukprot:g22823.t1
MVVCLCERTGIPEALMIQRRKVKSDNDRQGIEFCEAGNVFLRAEKVEGDLIEIIKIIRAIDKVDGQKLLPLMKGSVTIEDSLK